MSALEYLWDGEAMQVIARHQRIADKQFIIGKHYRLDISEERSTNSHSHFFAAVSEAWKNLPEDQAERFATADHLRKYALIKAGFFDERSIVAASKAEAVRIAAFVRPMDEFALVVSMERIVKVYTAKSQSFRAMGKANFQASKEAVLEVLAVMVGVKPESLSANAGRAA